MWGTRQHSIILGSRDISSMEGAIIEKTCKDFEDGDLSRYRFLVTSVRNVLIWGVSSRSAVPEPHSKRVNYPLFWGLTATKSNCAFGQSEGKALQYLHKLMKRGLNLREPELTMSDRLQCLINRALSTDQLPTPVEELGQDWGEMQAAFCLRPNTNSGRKAGFLQRGGSIPKQEDYLILEKPPKTDRDWLDLLVDFWAKRSWPRPCLIYEANINANDKMCAHVVTSKEHGEKIALIPLNSIIKERNG
jgi:hypothetical protein